MLDVAFVGGGPAGLCMGHALQRAVPGLNFQVFDRVNSYRPAGKHLNTRQPPVQAKANGGGLAGWYEIQSLLYKYLGTEHVSFSHHFQGCVQEDDSVAVVFHGQPSVRAKLPIGADGYFSAVRAQCPNDGPPSFSGKITWRSRAPWKEGLPNKGTSAWQFRGGNRIGIVYPIPGGQTVDSGGANADSLRSYERSRMPRVRTFVENETVHAGLHLKRLMPAS
ncbi:hypothetical protein WJX84_004991 [Apatococcus fuscideae]|uniref:FAD-binding domain-containing protein n=1 Tax=Apatococcus fuscideae TaxID=2026836 RepID=A0AAW1STH6_9CHLO